MPDLTPDQKEHLKMARRSRIRIEETWQLFCMYLSNDKRPLDALEMAREAVCVWADWMDDAEVEPPDIDRPDFGDEVLKGLGKMFERAVPMMGAATPDGMIFAARGELPAEQSDPTPQSPALEPTETSSQQEPTKRQKFEEIMAEDARRAAEFKD